MLKWEYKLVDLEAWVRPDPRYPEDEGSWEVDLEALQAAGSEGWEVVAVLPDQRALCKRPAGPGGVR